MLNNGSRLGPYEVSDALGAGGMGEVYRARDTRLDRPVAIKVLPPHLASNPDFKLRFEREAKVISALNHPNICTLHDVGEQEGIGYLVMELCEGESLADRLLRGPMPTEQVLTYGMQIADALDRAHRGGVIHRDLKPGNIMITKSGAKLLDFGLAKPSLLVGAGSNPPAATGASIFDGLTQHKPLTAEGSIVGTFQYMAPEQFEGLEADARSDIFAFGCILYEMATGKRAFDGKTKASLISSILERDPQPISEIQPLAPPALQRVISTSLAKDPDDRWQSAHDILLELRWIKEGGSQAGVAAPVAGRRKRREVLAWSVAALAAILALAATISLYRATSETEPPLALNISPNMGTSFDFAGEAVGTLAISPEGTQVVFRGKEAEGKSSLWIRDLTTARARVLPGTEGALWPFFSFDGKFVAFFSDGKLRKVAVSGGPPTTICVVSQNNPRPGSWNSDGVVLFSPSSLSVVHRVSASGGKPVPVTTLAPGETTHRWATFLPDGNHFLYLAGSHASAESETNAIWVSSLDGMKPKLLLRARSNAFYADGHLLYVQEGTLYARKMDLQALEVTGDPIPIADSVYYDSAFFFSTFATSSKGSLVFRSGAPDAVVKISWFDRSGKIVEPLNTTESWADVRLAPDGKSFVGEISGSAGSSDLWLYDLERNVPTRFTFGPLAEFSPVWSRDGKRIAFSRVDDQVLNIYVKDASGTGPETILYQSAENKLPSDFSPDGQYLAFTKQAGDRVSIELLPLRGGKPIPFHPSNFNANALFISPDGRWALYASDESGRSEVYAVSFPGPGGKWQVSSGGSDVGVWSRDGSEILLTTETGLYSVPVSASGDVLRIGVPKLLFQDRRIVAGDLVPFNDRFLTVHRPADLPDDTLTILTDWTASLSK